MAAAVQNTGSTGPTGVQDSFTVSVNVSSGSNRIVIAIFHVKKSTTPPTLSSTPTYNGVAMTKITAASESWDDPLSDYKQSRIDVYYILEPNLTNGTGFIVSATYDADFDEGHMGLFQIKDAFQGSPTHFVTGRGSAVLGPISGRIIDTVSGSLIVGILNGTSVTLSVNQPSFTITGDVSNAHFSSTGGIRTFTGLDGTSKAGFSDINVSWLESGGGGGPILADVIFSILEINDNDWVASTEGIPGLDNDADGNPEFCPYVEDGQVRKMVSSVTGLAHLEKEKIQIQMDGILPTDANNKLVTNEFTVDNGAITLPKPAAVVHAGLPYDGVIRLLKQSGGSAIGSGQTKMRRTYLAVVRFFKSLGLKVGPDEDNLSPIFDVVPALPLISGDKRKLPITNWDDETEMVFKQEDPLPCLILMILLESEVEEK